ncbi:MAG: DMT family transporter [Burkholderiales bacterium]|nr:DMT family transporter [Burkholderiales bacterium]
MSAAHPEHGESLRGIALLVAAVSTFAVMDTIAKWLAQTYPVPAVVWARYMSQVLVMVVLAGPRYRAALVRTRRPGLQLTRGVVLVSSTMLFFSAISLMPIAEASAITFISPLILTGMSVVLLKERVSPAAWVAVAFGFVGVLVIIRPGSGIFSAAAALPIATAFFFAAYQLLTRKLAGVDSTIATLFISALVGAVVMCFVVPFFWRPLASPWHALLLLAMGFLATAGHFMLIRAFEKAPASTLAPFVYAQLGAVLLLGYLVFGNFPDGWSLVGMGLIVASGAYVVLRQRR